MFNNMQRAAIHSIVTLLTFAAGILAYGLSDYPYVVLPSVLLLLILSRKLMHMHLTLHHLKVAVITVILSAPAIYIFFAYFIPRSGLSNCEPDLSGYEVSR
jgi:cytochrome bd-type quinol oxidase subunit 2